MSKILMTGGAGFIGSHVTESLVNRVCCRHASAPLMRLSMDEYFLRGEQLDSAEVVVAGLGTVALGCENGADLCVEYSADAARAPRGPRMAQSAAARAAAIAFRNGAPIIAAGVKTGSV